MLKVDLERLSSRLTLEETIREWVKKCAMKYNISEETSMALLNEALDQNLVVNDAIVDSMDYDLARIIVNK